MKKNIKLFCIVILIFFKNNLVFSNSEIEILFKIDNEIITNIDVEKEKRYLIALNNKLSEIPASQLNIIAKESLIKEIIKKKELNKFFDLNKTNEYSEKVAKNFYKRINLRFICLSNASSYFNIIFINNYCRSFCNIKKLSYFFIFLRKT